MKRIILSTALLCSTTLWADFNFGECSGSGSFAQHIDSYGGDTEYAVTVGTIPEGIQGLEIYLESDVDVDVRLYGENEDKIVHWPSGILNGASVETKPYKDVNVTYSGYNGTNGQKGHEYIKVEGTTPVAMTMKAFGYREGDAVVNYSWTGKDGCEEGSGSGSFTQDIPEKDIALVGDIPAGIMDLTVSLKSDKDIDIQLYGEDGTAIIAWPNGLLHGANTDTVTYNGMQIEWSGYNGTDGQKGHEYIKITGETTEKVTMKVYGYQAGSAEVDYSWGRVDNVIPDYVPTLTEFGISDIHDGEETSMIIRIRESLGGKNTGPLQVFIPKFDAFPITFDNETTQVNGTSVDNMEWKLTEISAGYIFEYIANDGNYPASTAKSFAITLTADLANNQSGSTQFEISILKGNGEEDLSNNIDKVILEYSNVIPDYQIKLEMDKKQFYEYQEDFFMTISIAELQGGENNGTLSFLIAKNYHMNLDFDNTLVENTNSSSAYTGAHTLSNSNWALSETPWEYVFTYIGSNGKYPKNEKMHIGISGVMTIEAGSKGKFFAETWLKSGSGDKNTDNNADRKDITYFYTGN